MFSPTNNGDDHLQQRPMFSHRLVFDVAEEQGAALLRKLSMKKVPSQSCLSQVTLGGAQIQPLGPYRSMGLDLKMLG